MKQQNGIKNLSDVRRLPRAGKIHLGIREKTSTKCKCEGKKECRLCLGTGFIHRPKETDYFVVPSELQERFGEQPKEIPIMFPVDNPAIFFRQSYKRYGFDILICTGNGEEGWTWSSEEKDLVQIPCCDSESGQKCMEVENGKCKRIGILQFLIPEAPGLGVWQITTSSRNSIIDINSSLDMIRAMLGRVHMIPLLLKRVPMTTQHFDKNGKAQKGSHWTMQIEIQKSLTELQQLAMLPPSQVLLPPADEKKDLLFYDDEPIPEKAEEAEDQQPELKKNGFDEAEIKSLRQELEYQMDRFQEVGGAMTLDMFSKAKDASSPQELKGLIEYYKKRVSELKKIEEA